uniref:Uncharacterized protein n=1 Tax=Romanomermis culicivorax TaxID=13658 RepID=A0A915I1F7_ROMCU
MLSSIIVILVFSTLSFGQESFIDPRIQNVLPLDASHEYICPGVAVSRQWLYSTPDAYLSCKRDPNICPPDYFCWPNGQQNNYCCPIQGKGPIKKESVPTRAFLSSNEAKIGKADEKLRRRDSALLDNRDSGQQGIPGKEKVMRRSSKLHPKRRNFDDLDLDVAPVFNPIIPVTIVKQPTALNVQKFFRDSASSSAKK